MCMIVALEHMKHLFICQITVVLSLINLKVNVHIQFLVQMLTPTDVPLTTLPPELIVQRVCSPLPFKPKVHYRNQEPITVLSSAT